MNHASLLSRPWRALTHWGTGAPWAHKRVLQPVHTTSREPFLNRKNANVKVSDRTQTWIPAEAAGNRIPLLNQWQTKWGTRLGTPGGIPGWTTAQQCSEHTWQLKSQGKAKGSTRFPLCIKRTYPLSLQKWTASDFLEHVNRRCYRKTQE